MFGHKGDCFFKADYFSVSLCTCVSMLHVCSSSNLPEDMTLEKARNIFLLLEDKM